MGGFRQSKSSMITGQRSKKTTTYHLSLAQQRNRVTFFRPEDTEKRSGTQVYYPDDKQSYKSNDTRRSEKKE
jgi:hypothetical protein